MAINHWKTLIADWPERFPRKGILITVLNEATPFKNFWLKGEVLLLERAVPDALGGRFMLLGFDAINCVKFTDPLSEEAIEAAGFTEQEADSLASAL